MAQNKTPGGFKVTPARAGQPPVGSKVAVKARVNPLDWPYKDREGTVLGYSVPHGFAIVSSHGEELLIHPENLDLV
jgi:hypothetical protein